MSPPLTSHRKLISPDRKNYQSLLTVDKKQDPLVNTVYGAPSSNKKPPMAKGGARFPKTAGTVSLNRRQGTLKETSRSPSYRERQLSDESRKTGTTHADTKAGQSLAFSGNSKTRLSGANPKSIVKSSLVKANKGGDQQPIRSSGTFSISYSDQVPPGETASQHSKSQKQVRRRYNPYRDPNFNKDAPQFDNTERIKDSYA